MLWSKHEEGSAALQDAPGCQSAVGTGEGLMENYSLAETDVSNRLSATCTSAEQPALPKAWPTEPRAGWQE